MIGNYSHDPIDVLRSGEECDSVEPGTKVRLCELTFYQGRPVYRCNGLLFEVAKKDGSWIITGKLA